MRERKVRTVLLASTMIMLSSAMVIGGTYALWSERVTVNNHLSAGSLKVELKRTHLEKYVLGDDMYMTRTVDDVEASAVTNMFGMDDNELIVPSSYYAAKLKLTNTGDVAIDYTIKIVVDSNSDEELAKQVIVHVGDEQKATYSADTGYTMMTSDECHFLAKDDTTEENVDYLNYEVGNGFMDKNQREKEFWVEIMFDNISSDIQNEAQDKNVNFDLLITATQKI